METVELFEIHDHIDDLIVQVLSRYDMHLSAKAISRTIWKLFQEDIPLHSIVRHISTCSLPCETTETSVKKYLLRVACKNY